MENFSYFMGRDGFMWFIGVVEDRNDPERLGRVRVRALGYHTDDKTKIPTDTLPWASVMMPVTTPSMNGLGHTPFLVQGSWVVGFFRDAQHLQEPVVLGTLPGRPSGYSKTTTGFNDPGDNKDYGYFDKDTDTHTYPVRIEESDINRLAVPSATHGNRGARDDSATLEVPLANTTTKWDELKTTDETSRGKTEERGTSTETNEDREEKKRVGTEYPYNHVRETESGHILEYDDTPFAERIHEYHRTGTFYEVDADGNKVTRIVGSNYEVVAGSEFVNVKGDCNLTVDSNCRTYIKGNWDIQVDGDKTVVVKGNHSETVSGTQSSSVSKDVTESYGANQNTTASDNIDIRGKRIDLNKE
tara:strand:- start:234 stop:1307 length:1074 start_codon:yes stop_codon:yes gene_type:complete